MVQIAMKGCNVPRARAANAALRSIFIAAFLSSVSPIPALFAEDAPSAVGPLMKLFQSGRLPAERQGAVVEMICNRGNEHDLKVVFDKLFDANFPEPLRLKAMSWLTDAATTRKVRPAGDLASLGQLVDSKDAKLRIAAVRLGALWKLPAMSQPLQKIALAKESSPELRAAALEGLVALGDEGARATLIRLSEAGQPIALRMKAVAGLTAFDLKSAAARAAAVLVSSMPQDDPAELLDAFFNRKGGAESLAAAISEAKPPTDVAKRSLRYMYSIGRSDAELSNVLSQAAGVSADPPPPTPEEVAKLSADVIAKGDPARGERIFRRADVSCFRCHSLSRAGGQVGPDLSALGGSSPVDYIVNSILNPNLAVKEQYVTRVFILANGMVLTGIVIDRDETRVRIRDAQGKTVVIPAADIDDEAEGKSLMPQGLTKFLTRDEVVDLARFVSELGKPGPYEIRKTPTLQRWRLMKSPPKELTEDLPHLELIREKVLGSPPEAWIPAYAMVAGELPLEEFRRPGETSTVLILQGELQVNEAGPLKLRVTTTENAHVWVDDAPFESRPEFTVELALGKHLVSVRCELSDRPSPVLKVEFEKPEASNIQFEVVGGM